MVICEKKLNNSRKSRITLVVRDYFVPLPSRNVIEQFAPGAVKDARVITQGIFYAHTSEVCKRPHYTNSGGTPVDISPRTKSITFRDREGYRFLCRIGESDLAAMQIRSSV